MHRTLVFILIIFIFKLTVYGQYKISGYIETPENERTIYLSLLKYNEEVAIYPEQIITSTKTDSTGYFEISGKLLPKENQLYRIHANKETYSTQLEFIESGPDKNYHNFIFSNTDTIHFPGSETIWFHDPFNTNTADAEWRKSIIYESKLREEYRQTKNSDARSQSEANFFNAFKQYSSDSLSDPLVKSLAYVHLKRNTSSIKSDFRNDPDFYYSILEKLNVTYSGTSYYDQFKEEISKLSVSDLQQKTDFFKRLNYVFLVIIIILILIIIVLIYLLRKEKRKKNQEQEISLTTQEKKVAELISCGKSNKEIASDLFVSLSTVKTHISNINSKLNTSNRQELVEKLKNHTGD